jgi:hypothetical protein
MPQWLFAITAVRANFLVWNFCSEIQFAVGISNLD